MKTVRSSDPSQRGPRMSLITQIYINESDPKRCVGVGQDLDPAIREDLITFLKENKYSFAWSSANLRGISLEVTSHELNVDPTYRPIKQKRRKLGPERAKAVHDEVNRVFADQLGKTMEVYIDDMLVKSACEKDHVLQLRECFKILNKFEMKLNPEKCSFEVPSGEFLGYLVTERGIEANPKQIAAFIDMPSPKTAREVQRLIGRIAALKRFISRSTDECIPFYQLIRKDKKFDWNEDCEQAFKQLKAYLSEPPILAKPKEGEPLYLYTAVSRTAISGVLVRDDHEGQKPIYYVSNTLIDAKTRYPAMEKLALAVVMSAQKLRPYFLSHLIVVMTSQQFRTILHSPTQSGRLSKWAIELSEYDIEYCTRTSLKAHVLTDFVIELPLTDLDGINSNKKWLLHVDGSSNRQGSGVGIQLTSPTGEVIEQSFRLGFNASNNEFDYETLIAGIKLAQGMGICDIHAHSDSQLVTSQFHGEYEAKDKRMEAYLELLKTFTQQFESFELTRIPRGENTFADALAALASTTTAAARALAAAAEADAAEEEPELGTPEQPASYEPEPYKDWRIPIIDYIERGITPPDKWETKKLKAESARYCIMEGRLMKRSVVGPYMMCTYGQQTKDLMKSMHEGQCGSHCSGRTLALRIKKQGYFWPTMLADCVAHSLRCDKCQRHAPTLHQPPEEMSSISSPYPFTKCSMDVVRPMEASGGKKRLKNLLVLTDYSTKWIKAKAFQQVIEKQVEDFLWENIVCRHGIPYEIVTDNGTNLPREKSKHFAISGRSVLPHPPPVTHKDNMDFIDERRDQGKIRVQNYQQTAARYYNSNIKIRRFKVGELVLRKVFSNTRELNAGKLGTNWEGLYRITEVVRDGVYKLVKVINGLPELRSWNAMHLKKYHE
ncbi:Reverse transcriptase domain [Arabidopsis suecica]|uniref:Reverse transcriptase domain n=1 Tax=Arabidopsis suecica TaxID=45249 RepID=A0A8T1XGY5_ARASU|nr:Reverse transcriptase domain [Arabidopsis suecica]